MDVQPGAWDQELEKTEKNLRVLGGFLLLISHIQYLVPTTPSLSFHNIEYSGRGEEGSQLVESIVARIEVGLFLLQ